MASYRGRLRGRVMWHLATAHTLPPAAPNLPFPMPAWAEVGESFFDNDGVRLIRNQTLEDEEALNELEPVGVWRNSDIKMLSGRVKDFSLETLQVRVQQ